MTGGHGFGLANPPNCTPARLTAGTRELHSFKVMPKRWIVERSFVWLEKNRRLWKNCERLLNTSLKFVHLAFLGILLRRL